jgi:hypothetical protein
VLKKDIPKLGKFRQLLDDRYILLFDEDNYLKGSGRKSKGSRINRILTTCDTKDSRIRIMWVNKEGKILKVEKYFKPNPQLQNYSSHD